MKVGCLIVTTKGLEALARAGRAIGAGTLRLEVHKDDDTHGAIRLCCTQEAGWIDLMKGFDG